MQLIQLDQNRLPKLPPLAFTIGNFDGVHVGHQAILKRLKSTAHAQELKTAVMFFEPQPKEFFATSHPDIIAPARISNWQEKVDLLAALNIDYVILAPFNDTFRQQTAQDFSDRLEQLNVKHIMVGDDFKFGHDRSGDSTYLEQHGFSVDHLETVVLENERVSSTRIRETLAQGNLTLAAELLGRPYCMSGEVEYGDQIGRTMDFPTANVALNRPKPCLHGIYGVDVTLVDGTTFADVIEHGQSGVSGLSPNSLFGAAHVGTRPAIKDKPPEWRLEVHLPKFAGNLYGKKLKITFLHFLHGEKNYEGLDALKAGILDDVDQLLAWRDKQLTLTST